MSVDRSGSGRIAAEIGRAPGSAFSVASSALWVHRPSRSPASHRPRRTREIHDLGLKDVQGTGDRQRHQERRDEHPA